MTAFSHKLMPALLLILTGAVFGFFYNDRTAGSLTHSELFELRRNCAQLSREFAAKQSGVADDGFALSLKLRYSDYSIARKSCFAEFDTSAIFRHAPNENFAEYQIYDVLRGQKIAALTMTDRNPETSQWSEYMARWAPEYYKIRSQIFGTKE